MDLAFLPEAGPGVANHGPLCLQSADALNYAERDLSMTNDTTQPDNTPPADPAVHTETAKSDPTGVEGANPALDDTGHIKAGEVGEAPQPPENPENLDLTPEGLSDEPAKQEDPESLASPENS